MPSTSHSLKSFDAALPEKPTMVIGWIHVKNADTSLVVSNFKRIAGNARVKEMSSLEELKAFLSAKGEKLAKYKAMVTEMGFWEDAKHSSFNRTAGLIAMELINTFYPACPNKFVISERVGKNEDGLMDKSRVLGFRYTSAFEPICEIRPITTLRERELHQCIGLLRNSLFAKPIHPAGEAHYPIKDFNIKTIFDVENESTSSSFMRKRHQLSEGKKPTEWEWMFHGSKTPESTYNITKTNFSLSFLGSYSGNRGCYGEGVYLSTRGYMPMVIAISQGHLMIIAAKVMKGRSHVVKHLTVEEYTKGVPIEDAIDSNVSENSIEVVIRDPDQILPSFVITFAVEGLKTVGKYIWHTPQGDKELPDIYCQDKRLLSFG